MSAEIEWPSKLSPRAPALKGSRKVQIVVVSSKYCNLRCRYCYELPDLANKTVISAAQFSRMYQGIADHYYGLDHPVQIEFDWHGGEPLLLDPDFYWRTFDEQTRIFPDPRIRVTNSVQTNLTILSDRHIKLLDQGFDNVGVSIDLFSGLRVNTAGRDLESKVLANMERLREAGVNFACITVLGRNNLPHLEKIFRFYEEAELCMRILPLHRGADGAQNSDLMLTEAEILQALTRLFEWWLESPAQFVIEPINSYVAQVIQALTTRKTFYYDKSRWEYVYLVNTDGSLYSYSDAFEPARSHGNIFEQPLRELVNGPRHRRIIEVAESRMRVECPSCRHHGAACSGYPMAEEAPLNDDFHSEQRLSCVRYRGILDHIERRILELGVVTADGKLNRASKAFARLDPGAWTRA